MKKVKSYKRWNIYQTNDADKKRYMSEYLAFLPEQSPHMFDPPEWEADTIRECMDFIDCYNK